MSDFKLPIGVNVTCNTIFIVGPVNFLELLFVIAFNITFRNEVIQSTTVSMWWCRKSDAEVPEFLARTDEPGSDLGSSIQVEPAETLNNTFRYKGVEIFEWVVFFILSFYAQCVLHYNKAIIILWSISCDITDWTSKIELIVTLKVCQIFIHIHSNMSEFFFKVSSTRMKWLI